MNNELPKGIQTLVRDANNGNPLAAFEISRIYREGDFGVSKSPDKAEQYFQQLEAAAQSLTFNLKELKLKNFRAFDDLTLKLDESLTVIIGNNGSGKTAILEAISKSLSWVSARILTSTGKGSPVLLSDIQTGTDYSEVTTCFSLGDNKIAISLAKANERFAGNISSDLSLSESLGTMYKQLGVANKEVPIPLFAYYAVDRTLKHPSGKQSPTAKISSRFMGLDDGITAASHLERFFSNYIALHNLANDADERDHYKKLLSILNVVLERAVEGVRDFKVKRPDGRDAIYVRNQGREINIWQLSDGQKVLLALMGDIALRMLTLNGKTAEPIKNTPGIILIDELELHLHPKWQRQIISALTETFSRCQFIVTTHSPQIPGEIQAKHLRILTLNDKGEATVNIPEQSYGLTTSAILEMLMGADSRNKIADQSINEIFRLIEDESYIEARAKIDELKKKMKGSDSKLTEAESWLTMLEE